MIVEDFRKSAACIIEEAKAGVDSYRLVDRMLVVLNCAVQRTIVAADLGGNSHSVATAMAQQTAITLAETLEENFIFRTALSGMLDNEIISNFVIKKDINGLVSWLTVVAGDAIGSANSKR